MPASGFRTITVDEATYDFADRLANSDNISKAKLIKAALNAYHSQLIEIEKRAKIIAKALADEDAKTARKH